MSTRHPKPWVVDLGWAGFFLALFIWQGLNTEPDPEPRWAEFPLVPEEAYPPRERRYPDRSNPPERAWSRPEPRVRPKAASDTVGAVWLTAQGWPDWKVEGFLRDRSRWGGGDSALLRRWDARGEVDWVLIPPEPLDLNSAPEEVLYQHPLWRSAQVRALHRFRSRVRPVASWTEVFALAPFDSAQVRLLPQYFYIRK